MSTVVFDLVLIGIVVLCCWHGFKTGLINGILGILAVIISIYAAGLVSEVYSPEFTGALEPFATGVVDSTLTSILTWDGEKSDAADPEGDGDDKKAKAPPVILTPEQKEDVYTVCHATLTGLGIADAPAKDLAEQVAKEETVVGQEMSVTLTSVLCRRGAYVAGFALVFMLVAIAFCAVANIIDIKFGIPGLENVNHVLGALLGAAMGIMIIITLTSFCRYLGLFIPEKVMTGSRLFGRLVVKNRVADMFGF